jgi:CubicO group peptidase (beta-lactamase class C family)
MASMARPSPLISVLGGRFNDLMEPGTVRVDHGAYTKLIVWILLGCSVSACKSNTPRLWGSGASFAEAIHQLGSNLERWEAFGFSGAVLVSQQDRVLLARGYGLADRSTGRKNDAETLFNIGSLSKQFTAAAVLALAEDRKLDIHGSITQAVEGVPAEKQAITIHQLLTHTSGIADGNAKADALSRGDVVSQILANPLTSPPGTEYSYSNDGYTLLAVIVEMVSGEPFERVLAQRLFAPAGMRRTTVTWDAKVTKDRVALGYGGYRAPVEGEDPRDHHGTWWGRGNGNVLSTIEDLLKWHRALRAGRILAASSLAAMFTPHTTAEAAFLSYGYAWRIQTTSDGKRLFWHSGLDEAYSSMCRYYEDDDVLVVFLSNLSIGGVPMREILVPPSRSGPQITALFAEAISAAPAYSQDGRGVASYGGRYRLGQAGRLIVTRGESGFALHAEGQEAVDALFPPPDAAGAAANTRASQDAERLGRCLADPGCRNEDLVRVDSLGYARRNSSKVREEWEAHAKRLGALQRIRASATTGLRGRNPNQRVTCVRLDFAQGVVDEHVIWFADDEIYWIPGQPSTTTLVFRPAPGRGLVGFDLLKQRVYRLELSDDGEELTVDGGDRTYRAAREPDPEVENGRRPTTGSSGRSAARPAAEPERWADLRGASGSRWDSGGGLFQARGLRQPLAPPPHRCS